MNTITQATRPTKKHLPFDPSLPANLIYTSNSDHPITLDTK